MCNAGGVGLAVEYALSAPDPDLGADGAARGPCIGGASFRRADACDDDASCRQVATALYCASGVYVSCSTVHRSGDTYRGLGIPRVHQPSLAHAGSHVH